jgi:hypothetical protein
MGRLLDNDKMLRPELVQIDGFIDNGRCKAVPRNKDACST